MSQRAVNRTPAIYAAEELVGPPRQQNERHVLLRIVAGLYGAPELVWSFSGLVTEVVVELLFHAFLKIRAPSSLPPMPASYRAWYLALRAIQWASGIMLSYTALSVVWQFASCCRSMLTSSCLHPNARIDLMSQFLVFFFANSTAIHVLKNLELVFSEEFETPTPTGSVRYDHIKKMFLQVIPLVPFPLFSFGISLWLGATRPTTNGTSGPDNATYAQGSMFSTQLIKPVMLLVLGYWMQEILLRMIAAAKRQLLA